MKKNIKSNFEKKENLIDTSIQSYFYDTLKNDNNLNLSIKAKSLYNINKLCIFNGCNKISNFNFSGDIKWVS